MNTSPAVCAGCGARVNWCARCGRPLEVGDKVRCDPDEGRPRHMHARDGEEDYVLVARMT